MRAEILLLLLLCFLARRQYGTVSVTADCNVLRAALWSQPQHVCTEYLTQDRGGKSYSWRRPRDDVILQMLTKL